MVTSTDSDQCTQYIREGGGGGGVNVILTPPDTQDKEWGGVGSGRMR